MDTKGLESSEEVTQSKDSISLSLLDDVSEIILHESVSDQVTPDVTIAMEKGDSEKTTGLIEIHGQIFQEIVSGIIALICDMHLFHDKM